jgi:hypothetical protein
MAKQPNSDTETDQGSTEQTAQPALSSRQLTMSEVDSWIRTHELRLSTLEAEVAELSAGTGTAANMDALAQRMEKFLNRFDRASAPPPVPAEDAASGE